MVLISRKVTRTGLVALAVLLSVLSWTPDQAAAAVPEPRFGPERTHPGYAGRSLVMEDFTGDGRKDVATTLGWSPDASVAYKLLLYAQASDGSLQRHSLLDTSQTEGMRVNGGLAAGDFDVDGRTDLAVPTGSTSSSSATAPSSEGRSSSCPAPARRKPPTSTVTAGST